MQVINYLCVCNQKDEWEYDWEDLKDGMATAYADNLDEPMFSEMGTIGIRLNSAGGLARRF